MLLTTSVVSFIAHVATVVHSVTQPSFRNAPSISIWTTRRIPRWARSTCSNTQQLFTQYIYIHKANKKTLVRVHILYIYYDVVVVLEVHNTKNRKK